jgi:hypothetical protein
MFQMRRLGLLVGMTVVLGLTATAAHAFGGGAYFETSDGCIISVYLEGPNSGYIRARAHWTNCPLGTKRTCLVSNFGGNQVCTAYHSEATGGSNTVYINCYTGYPYAGAITAPYYAYGGFTTDWYVCGS